MIINDTPIAGLKLLEINPRYDERGFVANLWDTHTAQCLSLDEPLLDCQMVFVRNSAAIHGLHYHAPMHDNPRLVRCLRGSVFFVVIDLRKNSDAYLNYYGFPLRHDKYQALFIPKGMAYGFQSLTDQCEIMWHTTAYQSLKPTHGIRWDDTTLGIKWPLTPRTIDKSAQKAQH